MLRSSQGDIESVASKSPKQLTELFEHISGSEALRAEYDRLECGLLSTTPRLLVVLGEIRTETGDCTLADGARRLALDGKARVADIGTERWQRVNTPAGRDAAEAMLARP